MCVAVSTSTIIYLPIDKGVSLVKKTEHPEPSNRGCIVPYLDEIF